MDLKKDKSYLVILLLLLIILIASVLLYKNIHSGATGNDNEVVGTLTFKHKTIERKYDTDVIWENIESGLQIRNKDTIRSGSFSDAVLTLKDKTKININENSMIYIDMNEGDINLNFAYGSMSLSKRVDGYSDTTLKIKSGNNTLEVKNSDLTLEKKSKEELTFQVNQGTAKLKTGNQEKEIKENESAKLNKAEIEISEVNLSLQSPADGTILTDKKENPSVTFSWNSKNAKNLKIELAYDSRFQNIYQSINAENNSIALNLQQGTYYWRISSEKDKIKKRSIREYSAFRKITIFTVTSPILLSPTKNQTFNFTTVSPIIPFSWNKLETARNYKLDISRKSDFSEIIKSVTTNLTSLGVDNLEPGKYYARISIDPIREEFKVDPSKTISFSIEKKNDLESPQLISPSDGQSITSIQQDKSEIILLAKDLAEINRYNFQVSKNNNFSALTINETVTANQIRLNKKLELGTYFWRVIGISQDGKNTPPSEIRKFSIIENQPIELISPKSGSEFDMKDNPVVFRWKKLPVQAEYLLEVSASKDFQEKIHSIKTQELSNSFSISTEGTFFWKVTAFSDDGSILSKSAILSFSIEEVEILKPIFPTRNERVDMSPLDSLTLRWEKTKKDTRYEVELYNNKNGEKTLIAKSKTKNSSYQIKDLSKLDEGNFIWTLQDLSKDKSNKVVIPFKIYLSEKPKVPEIRTPKKFYVE
ncbi:MAG TPA: FecR domain-containing protein [Leptospiraceae bacterium]|nr:FecR domain-containing protein [Leptospiraceae bacterium]HMW05577.1 FecR domain-containing protein [Leptospiraceae bacterium]HMX34221.1 FecR domain-containing protein [Leptospiraceae bacterium]HMY31087.1 FecR domain-containing protein [Leptospiraceae bacterium]HMZ65287.1 FecR domain-containing protein [Leptospiraceae bacterium]